MTERKKIIADFEWARCLSGKPKACNQIEGLDELVSRIKKYSENKGERLDSCFQKINNAQSRCRAHQIVNRRYERKGNKEFLDRPLSRYQDSESVCKLPCVVLFMRTADMLGIKLESDVYHYKGEGMKK